MRVWIHVFYASMFCLFLCEYAQFNAMRVLSFSMICEYDPCEYGLYSFHASIYYMVCEYVFCAMRLCLAYYHASMVKFFSCKYVSLYAMRVCNIFSCEYEFLLLPCDYDYPVLAMRVSDFFVHASIWFCLFCNLCLVT